ncbi:glycosyltransferase [Candidatus Bathyarchaeota archaeon]|nr:glycosyltransferase [Candidatus Bathyarchaeota archaeon]
MNILAISEMSLFKKLIIRGKNGTLGGIETNHKNLMRGLRKRGHRIIENKAFPKGQSPDIIICPTFGPISILMIWFYKRKYNCACVQHAHTTQDDMAGGFLPDVLVKYAGTYLKHLYKFSEIIITPSVFSKENLTRLEIPTRPPIYPVSNGVNLAKFKFSERKREEFRQYLNDQHEIDKDRKVILCVSVLWERKGVDVFYHVAKQFPEYEFVWVGNYITAKKLKERYDDLPNITFTGFVDDIVACYCGADAFFFPSRAENQGIPLLEAAACKLPILCRNLPTYSWLKDGIHCLKRDDLNGFVSGLKEIMAGENLRNQLINNALDNVQQHDINKIINQVERIYKRAIKLRRRLLEMQHER